MRIDDSDFIAEFDGRSWTALWKWKSGEEPPESLGGAVAYALAKQYEEEVSQELSEWKKNGWLIPFNGKAKAILPLVTVVQAAKGKVRPVLDYRALNEFVSSHTAESLVCAEKLRRWRKMGSSLEIIDLRRAYLQIKVDSSLWPY